MQDFTQGKIGKPLTIFAIPIILGNFFVPGAVSGSED